MDYPEAQEEEDLLENPFFQTLQSKFTDIYKNVEKNCFVVCVPTQHKLKGLSLSRSFISSHILKPSPEILGEYFTLNQKKVLLNGKTFSMSSGFPDQRKSNIKLEESFYNQNDQPFRVLIVDFPFEGSPQKSSSRQSQVPKNPSFMAAQEFFFRTYCMMEIDRNVELFCATYVPVPGYEHFVVEKVKNLCEEAVLKFEQDKFILPKLTTQKERTYLRNLTHTLILGLLYVKVFNEVCKPKFEKKDRYLRNLCQLSEGLTMDDLGISKSFQSSSDEASKQLELIDALLTPIEKLRCVNGCINLISKAVSQLPASKDSFTSDDLIPWLSFVILQNKPKYLQANQYYMEYFLFCECPSSLSFSLTTLTAAVHFLLSDHFLDVLKKLGKYDEKLLKGQSQPGFLARTLSNQNIFIRPRPEGGSSHYYSPQRRDQRGRRHSEMLTFNQAADGNRRHSTAFASFFSPPPNRGSSEASVMTSPQPRVISRCLTMSPPPPIPSTSTSKSSLSSEEKPLPLPSSSSPSPSSPPKQNSSKSSSPSRPVSPPPPSPPQPTSPQKDSRPFSPFYSNSSSLFG